MKQQKNKINKEVSGEFKSEIIIISSISHSYMFVVSKMMTEFCIHI